MQPSVRYLFMAVTAPQDVYRQAGGKIASVYGFYEAGRRQVILVKFSSLQQKNSHASAQRSMHKRE